MTLVELLITILIISILAALVLGVAATAGQTAREAKTRTMIDRLHTLLMEQYDTYKNRRLDTSAVEAISGVANPTPDMRADNRLLALRALMRMEMPDRWSDLINGPVGDSNLSPSALQADPTKVKALRNNVGPRYLYTPGKSELWSVYIRRYQQLANRTNTVTGELNTTSDVLENQSAECLYLIITVATGDGEARTLFHDRDIGDTDGDGAPEFLDGWGHPIGFLRWAPGFSSPLQLGPNRLAQLQADTNNDTVRQTVAADHDPFDMYQRDTYDSNYSASGSIYDLLRDKYYSYRLVPLIYSAGRDEVADIYTGQEINTTNLALQCDPYAPVLNNWLRGTPVALLSDGSPATDPPPLQGQINLPAMDGSNTTVTYFIDADTNGATDNVTNHLIGQR